jgi:putative sigma-54 modulation protein
MDVEYTGRQATITRKYKAQTEAGLERIEKVIGHAGNVHVVLSTDKYRQIAEIKVQTRSLKLVASCEATEMEIALRDALEKIEQQAIRHKKRKTSIKRHPKSDVKVGIEAEVEVVPPAAAKVSMVKLAAKSSVGRRAVPMLVHSFPSRLPMAEPHVVRSSDCVALRPMSLEEALKEAALMDRDIFVFRDYVGQAMVLHRKRDGKMELIEVP